MGYAQVQNGLVVCVTAADTVPPAGTLGVAGLGWVLIPAGEVALVAPGWTFDGKNWTSPPANPVQVAAGRVQSYGAAISNGIATAQGWQVTMGTLVAGQALTAAQVACLQQQTTAWVRLLQFVDHLLDAQGYQPGS